jgi:hypothetical protein
MSVEHDLGALIIKMNPYAGGLMQPHTFLAAPPPPPRHPPPTGATGAAPTPPTSATGAAPTPPTATPAAHPPDATCIWMEMDRYRTGDWAFKGQPRRIDTALRIAYRWAKYDDDGKFICWITDYLLIGYEGSNGGG